ncbi:MAG: hypothetical protein ACLU99_10840 [Alphaproteobacteria bacterium]
MSWPKLWLRKKNKAKGFEGVDISSIFLGDGKELGVWDFINDKGISIETLMKVGKKVFRHGAENRRSKTRRR